MTLSIAGLLVDARAAWRRDAALLIPLAGLGYFLPQLAAQLLLPPLPAAPATRDEAAMLAWTQAVQVWAGNYGFWYLLAPLLALFTTLGIFALYLGRDRPTLAGALRTAGRLFLRYLLASILVSLPMGGMLSIALLVPVLMFFAAAPIFYIYARTMLMGPVIVAEAPVGAVDAVARSWRLTKGAGWPLAALYAAIFLLPALLGTAALSVASAGGGNPVIVALGASLAAAVAAAGATLLALVEVAAYARAARKGT